MIIKNNEELSKYSKMRIGGIAKNFYIPETEEELIELVKTLKESKPLYIANGSNILINDKKVFNNIIYLSKFSNNLVIMNDLVEVGASVSLQKFITKINSAGLGGIEYLYSVPGSLGGAIFMNAGTGQSENKSISDYIVEIKTFDGTDTKFYSKEECLFKYRNSIFKSNGEIILSAKFQFPIIDSKVSKIEKENRLQFTKETQDTKFGNLGSIFDYPNGRIIELIRKIGLGWPNGIKFSKKANNWLINKGKGNFKQALMLIRIVELMHKITFRKGLKREIIVWK